MSTHECPAAGCLAPVPPEQLACRKHWALVSRPTQSRVYRAFRSGTFGEHADAIAEMNAALEGKPST